MGRVGWREGRRDPYYACEDDEGIWRRGFEGAYQPNTKELLETDIRMKALVTEAALNAIQRRYPQIYTSEDRLLLKPESIEVQARDFMIAMQSEYDASEFSNVWRLSVHYS
jgi:hypothetical protein